MAAHQHFYGLNQISVGGNVKMHTHVSCQFHNVREELRKAMENPREIGRLTSAELQVFYKSGAHEPTRAWKVFFQLDLNDTRPEFAYKTFFR